MNSNKEKLIIDYENLDSSASTYAEHFMLFKRHPSFNNYIELKLCYNEYRNAKKVYLSNFNENQLWLAKNDISGITKPLPKMERIGYFEDMIKIRKNRLSQSTLLICKIREYEKLSGENNDHSTCIISYLAKLNEIELNTMQGENFPFESYRVLPSATNFQLKDIKKLELELSLLNNSNEENICQK